MDPILEMLRSLHVIVVMYRIIADLAKELYTTPIAIMRNNNSKLVVVYFPTKQHTAGLSPFPVSVKYEGNSSKWKFSG